MGAGGSGWERHASGFTHPGGMDTSRTHHRAGSLAGCLAASMLAVGLVATAPSAASADEPSITCGTVVTSDVRLRADLLDCPGSGLVIGASGITIDLAGHVIDGTGAGAGIDNSAGHDDVHVTRGTIGEFRFGIHLFESVGGRLGRVAARSNLVGIIVERSEGVELDRVTAADNVGNGIEVGFSEAITVRRSTAAGNGHGGIVDRATNEARYEDNTVTGNVASGLDVWFSDGVVVERNHAAANDFNGILLVGIEDAIVEDRKSTRLNSSHLTQSRMPSSA